MTSPNMNDRKLAQLFTLYGIAVVVLVLDLFAKYVCNTSLVEGVPVTVFPGFDLLLAYNRGAAFSFLANAGGWQRIVLTGISVSVSVFLAIWMTRLDNRNQKLLGWSLALILGGAVGNGIDRALTGYVTDFISVYAGSYRFATFNIADSAISLGAGLMILDIFLDYRPKTSDGRT